MIKFLKGKPSLGFGGGSITVRKEETKQEETLTVVALGLGTITQFAMRDKVAFIGTAEGATLYNVNTKAKNTYTLADLGVTSIDELDISAEEDKVIVRSGTTVYLYAVANGAIDIASKVTLPYAYCNFTDINNRAIAGSGEYPATSGTTKILKFTTGLTYTVAEVLGGSWNHVGKATPQGYGIALANYWQNTNINTIYPVSSETDNPTCEVLTNLTDMGVSIDNTYTVARDGSNYKIYTNVSSGSASLTKTATGIGGTAFRFYSDTVIWALGKYSVKVYDFVNEEVLHTIGFYSGVKTNLIAACNEKLYVIDSESNLCIVRAADQAEVPVPAIGIAYSLPAKTEFAGTTIDQAIDTGIPQSDMDEGYCIAMVINPTEWVNYRGVFGLQNGSAGVLGFQYDAGTIYYRHRKSGNSYIQLNPSAIPAGEKQQLVINYDASTSTITAYRNGTVLGTATSSGPTANGNIKIGAAYNDNQSLFKGTIYSFDIYDRAATTEELATILGTPEPDPEPEPTIEEPDYIETTGTQYINTGIKSSNDINIEMKFNQTGTEGNYSALFGARDGYSAGALLFFNICNNSATTKGLWIANVEPTATTTNTYYQVPSILKYENNQVILTSEQGTDTISAVESVAFTGSYDMYLGGCNRANLFEWATPMKIYYCKIWKAGELVRNLTPRVVNGTVGMWDSVTETLFTNAGTGVFTYGNDTESDT